MIKQLIDMPMLNLNRIEHTSTTIWINASIKSNRSRCPNCGKFSKKIHDHYIRTISDLPVFQYRTTIRLKTRKFKCGNSRCEQKVFSEQTPVILRYSRRTNRVLKILESFAIELTGKLGSIISKQLCITVSSSTITRIAHNQQLSEIKQPRVLGVDDWAYRKGVSYGTILIDMETSRPIELLPSRDGKALKNWLLKYNDVEIVTRDRANSYSSAINEVCPHAVQIADRFHLLMNLSDALVTYFKGINSRIRSLINAKTNEFLELPDHESVGDTKPKFSRTATKNMESVITKADQRLETFNKVKELQAKGVPRKRISKDLKMSNNTVRSYFLQETLSPRTRRKSTNFDLFTCHVLSRIKTDGYILKDIYEEIREMGFNGEISQARYNINMLKEQSKISTSGLSQIQSQKIPYIRPLSSRKLAVYIGANMTEIIDPQERHYMQTILEDITELRIVRKLVQIFKTMLSRGRGNIKRWIDFILRSKHKLPGLKTFARGLLRDIEAVENGINMRWSNGAVEGHVNRIKSIKRQMYGRASFDLLRKKVILSRTG
jgi:transposase